MNHVFPRWNKSETGDFDALDAVAVLTSFCLLFVSIELRIVAALIVLANLFFRDLRRSPWLWLVAAVAWWPQLFLRWEHHEDHCYLLNYWCIAIGLSLLGSRKYGTLKSNAQLLIGLTFAFGCLWKITSPDYVDGSMMSQVLLFDWRFESGITAPLHLVADQAANIQAINAIHTQLASTAPISELSATGVNYRPALSWLSHAMTWWTVAIETVVALLFLFPNTKIAKKLKDGALMVFAITTYLFVPVVAFGCLFCAMGVAQCDHRQRKTRIAYLLLALFVMIRNNMVVYL